MSLNPAWCAVTLCGVLTPSMLSAQPVPPPHVPPRPFVMPTLPRIAVPAAIPGWFDLDLALRRAEAALDRLDLLAVPEGQQPSRQDERSRDREQRRADEAYQRGQNLLARAQWANAVEQFTQIIDGKASSRVDAALYWKAYALDKLTQQADALATLAELTRSFPASRWLPDAKALELQVRQNSGQPPRPDAEPDDDLKLLALQGLQHSDPEQAVPMLEQFLRGNQSPRLKERALFVLAQSSSPRARTVLTEFARGGSNPDVQRKAIQYLGVNGTQENRQVLADIYAGSTDLDIKRQILRAFMVAGDRARVLSAATTEQAPELRQEAVRQLGVMGGRDELWQLYQKESAVDVKKQILQGLFVGGDATRLIEVANTEANAELRAAAVRQLGLMGSSKTGEALVALYAREQTPSIKQQVIKGLFVQNNADALVALARKESDPQLKKELVQQLSLMKARVAVDYMMEILKQ